MIIKSLSALSILMITNGSAMQLERSEAEKKALGRYETERKLQWGTPEPTTIYSMPKCLIPSTPGCHGMWHEEKKKEYDEKMQRYYDKKNSYK